MPKAPINKFTQSVKGKIIIAFVVASLSLFLAWETSKIAFDEILSTVESISAPTERLRLVNKLTLKLVQLEQLQRTQTLNQQVEKKQTEQELKDLSAIIDTLNTLYRGDTIQLQRLASLNVLLKERNRLFNNYLKERQGFLDSESIAKQIQSLNELVEENTRKTDSAIIESEKRTLTTTIYELEEKPEPEPVRGFFNKLFGKKKSEPSKSGMNIINEELNVTFDTVALARQDSILRDLGESMRSIEKTQKIKSERFLNRESLLIYTSDLLVNRMLSV
ncbi:hybrid sensor histidine kinase/response regulator, partial [Pseudoxanthomonas sp. SGD-10]